MKNGRPQAKDIPDNPVLEFLSRLDVWATHGEGYSMPTVQDAMPACTPVKVQLAKMRSLRGRGLVDGCPCGCRGDWRLTSEGAEYLRRLVSEECVR